jgi:hypothetical protein
VKAGKASSRRVYVCQGTFKESITIERGVPMVGGFDCASGTWKASGNRTVVDAPTSPAVRATGIDIPTRFEGFEVKAPKGTDAAPSSIVLHAKGSPQLTIASSKLVAGRGDDGASGGEGGGLVVGSAANGKPSVPQANRGLTLPMATNNGGAGGVLDCVGAPAITGETGGRGGNGGSYVCQGNTYVVYTSTYGTFPAQPGEARAEMWGWSVEGAAGMDGVSATAGRLTVDGYATGNGTPGTNGAPGKGGRGGAGYDLTGQFCSGGAVFSASGPGGGAGGCPGVAGKPGTGGGASIGALVATSPGLSFEETEIIAGDGGNGGAGTIGASGTPGGEAQAGHSGEHQAYGGGRGGRPGTSGSGAGGPSIAIAYTAGIPMIGSKTRLVVGKAGAGVPEKKISFGEPRTRPASGAGFVKDLYGF